MNPHLTNDELLDWLYGLSDAKGDIGRHLQECSQCSGRMHVFESRKTELVAASPLSAEPSSEFLATQRREIYARLDEPGGFQARWAPAALAAGFLLAISVFLYHPAISSSPTSATPHATAVRPAAIRPAVAVMPQAELTDEELFSNVYSIEQSADPMAAAPIRAMFVSATTEGEQ